jgi:anti-sigma-K factor RskA
MPSCRRLVLRPLPAAALAALLLALGVAGGLLARGDGDAGGRELALAPVAPLGGAASGTARIADDGERATLHLTGLPPSRDGDFYELWLLNGPDDLVSLGSFTVPASGEVDVTVPVPGGTRGFAALDVSVEPPDGDPAHSSRSVLRAPLGRS